MLEELKKLNAKLSDQGAASMSDARRLNHEAELIFKVTEALRNLIAYLER